MRKIIAVFAAGVIFVVVFSFIIQKTTKPIKNLPPINSIADEIEQHFENDLSSDEYTQIPEDMQEPDRYSTAYMRGYNAFLSQVGRPDLISNQKTYIAYVGEQSNSADDEDADNRGYADGYHKASDSINCPRFKDPRYPGDKY